MQNKTRFGIIGCGAVGPVHAKCINNIDSAKLVAISDIILERAKILGQKYEVEYYQDYKKLLERKDIDVVDICLPSGMHMQGCVDAAVAGKNILCEKPLEITLDKIDRINEAVRKNKVKLGVVFQMRFQESSRRIKKALEDRKLGTVLSGSVYTKWYRTQAYYDSGDWRGTWELDGGGCLMNQGIHAIDLLQWFLGPVKSVYAITGTVAHKGIEVEDIASAVIRFKNGAQGVIEGSTSCFPGLLTVHQIYGTLGTIILKEGQITDWHFINPTKEDLDFSKQIINQKQEEAGYADSNNPCASLKDSHEYPIKDMIRAINDDVAPEITGEEARKSVEIILAIYKSARLGEEVILS